MHPPSIISLKKPQPEDNEIYIEDSHFPEQDACVHPSTFNSQASNHNQPSVMKIVKKSEFNVLIIFNFIIPNLNFNVLTMLLC